VHRLVVYLALRSSYFSLEMLFQQESYTYCKLGSSSRVREKERDLNVLFGSQKLQIAKLGTSRGLIGETPALPAVAAAVALPYFIGGKIHFPGRAIQ